jgi:hypothetical protein
MNTADDRDNRIDEHARCEVCDSRYCPGCQSAWVYEQASLGAAVAHALCAPVAGCVECGQPANGDYRCETCAEKHAVAVGFVRSWAVSK